MAGEDMGNLYLLMRSWAYYIRKKTIPQDLLNPLDISREMIARPLKERRLLQRVCSLQHLESLTNLDLSIQKPSCETAYFMRYATSAGLDNRCREMSAPASDRHSDATSHHERPAKRPH